MGNAESSMENENAGHEIATTSATRIHRNRRRYERATITPDDESSWWSTIENENLILEQVPRELTSSMSSTGTAAAVESEIRARNRFEKQLPNENVNVTLKSIQNEAIKNSQVDDNNVDEDDAQNVKNDEITNGKLNEKENENSKDLQGTNVLTTTTEERTVAREQSLEEFREELQKKRLARQTAVQDLRNEITTLRKQLASAQAGTQQQLQQQQQHVQHQKHDVTSSVEDLTFEKAHAVNVEPDEEGAAATAAATSVSSNSDDMDDVDPMSRGRHANIELANAQLALQLANSENISLRAELGVVQKQVGTLKEVISCCKQMLAVKEEQCNELKAKLTDIETSFGEREMKIMSENLRHEYERQLGNIRQLRELYEERQRISAAEHENLQRLISIKKDELLAEQEKTKSFEERNQTLIKEVESVNNELATLREECNEHKFEKKALKEEMGAVNTLFSQMVMGFNGKNNLDIDRLTTMLEENRTLLNDMATKEASCSDGATLPKLLFELVEQAMHFGNSSGRSRSTTPIPMQQAVSEGTLKSEYVAEDKQQQKLNNQHNETEEATSMNNDVAAAATTATAATESTSVEEDVDAVDGVVVNFDTAKEQHTTTTTTNNSYVDNNSNSGSCGDDGNVVISTKISKKQHQRRKLQNATSSSSSLPPMITVGATAAAPTNATMKFHEPEVIGKVTSAQEIIGNLPKVWKVLMELLSHHKREQTQFEENGNSEDCYKSVETPNGPKAELSVSKTYIKLKDLILEKKSLVKETNRLKTLNCHLEYRLNAQEKRLSTVSMELTKTWHLVGKMQRQHRQLHTQEQILRYQLQQKRRLLSELKDELEYCRRKWAAARAKNDESQEQCNDLRREFARRKLEDANNSAESGYSDSGPPSDEESASASIGVVNEHTGGAIGGGAVCLNSRRKHLREMFEHTRKIKRMQSTSPGRAAAANADANANGCNGNNATQETEIILRWNSAPPTCGWRRRQRDNEDGHIDDDDNDIDGGEGEGESEELPPRMLNLARGNCSRGAIPKQYNGSRNANPDVGSDTEMGTERAHRIQRLEEQCKSLIQQVLETSDNRERLEIQLCRFQDEIAPVQYAVPLEEFINKRRTERMSRASSAPATGTLTPREEEYTRKRSERLERLEEESRQLMSRIKRTSDRGHYLRCSLDRIRRAPSSREESFDSAPEDNTKKINAHNKDEPVGNCSVDEKSPLTAEEEAYTSRRAARLKRLEQEGQQLLGTLARNVQRGDTFESKLDTLHERYGGGDNKNGETAHEATTNQTQESLNIEQRLENIDQVTASRAERLRLLEEEGNKLIARLSNTSARGTQMINRIAEREQRRELRSNETTGDSGVNETDRPAANEDATTSSMSNSNNVDCAAILDDVVPTTSQGFATRESGAIPKSNPSAKLCAARHKSERFTAEKNEEKDGCATGESLEELVKRLRETPYPEEGEEATQNDSQDSSDLKVETKASDDDRETKE